MFSITVLQPLEVINNINKVKTHYYKVFIVINWRDSTIVLDNCNWICLKLRKTDEHASVFVLDIIKWHGRDNVN